MATAHKKHLELTRGEFEVMQHLWRLGHAFLGEVVESFGQPRPAYTTISTVIRTLEAKGFVRHRRYGNSHRYTPTLSRKEYAERQVLRLLELFFHGSAGELVRFMASEEVLSEKQRAALLEAARELIWTE